MLTSETIHPLPVVYVPPEVINLIVEFALAGHSFYNISEFITKRCPSYPVAVVFDLVGQHFLNAGRADAAAVRGFAIEGYRELYRKSLMIGDLATALKALARLEKAGAG